MSAWRVIHFPKEDTVEAVPVLWMRGSNQCYWPSFGELKLKTAISKCLAPSSDWDIHEARVIGEEYGDLSVARMRALEAENTSDLNSDSDSLGLGHRKILKNKKYVMDYSDSDQEKDDTPSPETSKIVMPVLRKVEKKTWSSSGELDNNLTPVSGNLGIVHKTIHKVFGNQFPASNDENIEPENGRKQTTEMDEVCSSVDTKDEQFRRQVLRNLSILHFKLDQLAEDIAQIALKKPEVPASPSIFLKFAFPLSTEEDLQTFETFLADRDNYKQVPLEFSRIGGSNPKVMVKRIMEKILTSQLGMTYSWIGFKKKKNFSVLTAKVLIEAVMTVHQKSTGAEVETSTKQWLVKCKERNEKNHKI